MTIGLAVAGGMQYATREQLSHDRRSRFEVCQHAAESAVGEANRTTVFEAVLGETPDAELIARVVRHEEEALGTIYDRYSRLVFTVALRITGHYEAAEEVMQDVFQTVWQAAGSFRPGSSLAAWLVGITRHRAIDHTRSGRYRWRAREELLDDQQHATSGERDADQLVERETVRLALLALPEVQRQALALAFYAGLTHVEIASRIGEPVGTVKSRIRLGLTKLRELLEAV